MSKNRLGSLPYGLLPLMLFFFLASNSLAQEKTLKPNQLVLEAQQKGVEFKAVNLLSPTSQTTAAMRESLRADLTDYSLFDASPMALQQTKRGLDDSKTISFNVFHRYKYVYKYKTAAFFEIVFLCAHPPIC